MRGRITTGLALVALAGLVACSGGPGERIGAVAGGAAGGVAGTQIGSGTGQLAATAGGAGVGALLGAEAGRRIDAANRAPTRRPVAEPTRQVPIPGAYVPGSFWSWLPDLEQPAPMRNVARTGAPAQSGDCVRLGGPRLKPAYRCTTGGVSYVVQ
jgi:hypothetical protein